MISKISLLQIGDVHLPSAARQTRNLDDKDETFSVELRNVISATPTKIVFKQMYQLLENQQFDAVLIMGDLTDRGSLADYEKACAYIAGSLQLGLNRNHHAVPLGIVPGNHDINRDLAKKPGLATKFSPLNAHLTSNGLPQLPVEKTRTLHIAKGTASASISLMNSCWGCGAMEYVPAEFRAEIGKAIEAAISAGGTSALEAYYDRQFDTPAFSNAGIEDVVQRASSLPMNTLMLLVAHHNLLPQRITRLAPYTELVNSGPLRSSLLSADRPILFLHGHIHDDPVELISNPGGQIVACISAPAVEEGFNVLDITFTRMGTPLSCRVVPWRFNSARVLSCGKSQTISLIGNRRRSHDATLGQIYSHLLASGEVYWSDLVKQGRTLFAQDIEDNLREAVELLMADGSAEVENYEYDPTSWIVRAKI